MAVLSCVRDRESGGFGQGFGFALLAFVGLAGLTGGFDALLLGEGGGSSKTAEPSHFLDSHERTSITRRASTSTVRLLQKNRDGW